MAHILVSQLARMGDLTQSLYLLKDLKQAEGHTVSVLVDRRLKEFLFELAPWVDTVYCLDMEQYLRGFRKQVPWLDLWRGLARELQPLQTASFDRVINLNFGRLPSEVIAAFRGESPVDGFFPGSPGHAGDPWVTLVSGLVQSNRRWNKFHLVDVFRFYASRKIPPEKLGVKRFKSLDTGSVLGIQVATRSPKRTWAAASFRQVIDRLLSAPGPEILLLGEEQEQDTAHHVLQGISSNRVKNLVGKTSLKELIAVLGSCDCLLSADTGTLHLASWIGVPSVSIYFGPANVSETGPYGPGHTVVQVERPCAPCREDTPCPEGKTCGQSVTPEMVVSLLKGEPVSNLPGIQIYRSAYGEGWLQYQPTWKRELTPEELVGYLYRGSVGGFLGCLPEKTPSMFPTLAFLHTHYRLDDLCLLPENDIFPMPFPKGMAPEDKNRLLTIFQQGWKQLKEMVYESHRKESIRIEGETTGNCRAC